jgi:signal transduction histidine kinase/CheY-like chemotaxis protein
LFKPVKKNKECVEKECFTLYMNEMLRNYIGSILIGLPLFYFIFQSYASLNTTVTWFLLDSILLISVLSTYYAFYKQYAKFDFSTWRKISYIPLLVFSIHIAFAPWLFLQSEADIYLYTMFIMIISLTGTVTHAIAYYFIKLVIFSSLPLLSLAAKFYTMDSDNSFEIYIVLILIWVGLLSFAHRINKSLVNSIILKFENIESRAKAERINAEKSQFIAAASHDIRQPLQAINLLVSTLKSRNTNDKDNLLFERLENCVDSMSELLNRLLDVSKLDAHVIIPQPQHLCLKPLLNKLQGELEPFAKAKGIELKIESEINTVFADAILLEQILNNLLSNAIRYTDTGKISLSLLCDSQQIEISIKDTGLGIANADQEVIFHEFHQLHNPERDQNKGLGLGLSIVKRLCELQNWPLSLDSKLGIGSCFSIKIPEGNSELIQVEEVIDMHKNLADVDIIIIDDHEGIRYSLSNMLNDWGCKVSSFESADSACKVISQSPTWRPNLIISDYRLRNNLTGIEAIKELRTTLSSPIKAILISGDTSPDKIKEIEESGLILLHKPIKPAKLRVVITQIMNPIIEKKQGALAHV